MSPARVVLVGGVIARHGRIDALVNAVGGFTGGSKFWEVDGRSSTGCSR